MYYIYISCIILIIYLEINVCVRSLRKCLAHFIGTIQNDVRSYSTWTRPIITTNTTGKCRHKLGTGGLRSQGTVIGLAPDQAMLMNLTCHYLNCS